jgi:Fe-S cluster biogenesis protein NfuA
MLNEMSNATDGVTLVDAVALPPPANDAKSTMELVEAAIAELRPHLKRDGGDIELIGIEGDMVVVELKGMCVDCVLSSVTLAGVRKKLIDMTGRMLRVVPRSALPAGFRLKAAS